MTTRSPTFSAASPCLLLLLSACLAAGADPAHRSGQELIDEAARQLYDGPPLEARLGCNVNLFDQQLTGTGSYLQFGGGTGKTRLVLAVAAGGKVFRKQLQITDGRHYLYVREENRGVKSLVSVDLRKVSRAMAAADNPPGPVGGPSQTLPTLQLSAVGGVPRLLAQLSICFDFGTPIESHLGDPKNRIPVVIIPGTWKREKLAALLPQQGDAILAGKAAALDQLPTHLPHEVEVTLGGDDKFPLFPYKIVYLRYPDEKTPSLARSGEMREILSLKLFEVRQRPQLRRELFDYRPENNEDDVSLLSDGTAGYISRLGLAPAGLATP